MSDDNIKVDPQALSRCAKALKEKAGPVGSVATDLPADYTADGWTAGPVDDSENLRAAVAKLLTALKTDAGELRSMLEDGERSLDDASNRYANTSDQITDDAKKTSKSMSDNGN